MIWSYEFKDNKSIWTKQESYIDTIITNITQEIQLWVNENPMSILSGINYKGVFDLEVFLRQEIQNIIEQYSEVEYHIVEQAIVNDNILTIKITLSINSELIKKELRLERPKE